MGNIGIVAFFVCVKAVLAYDMWSKGSKIKVIYKVLASVNYVLMACSKGSKITFGMRRVT